jgi:hypothetical protein
METNEPEEIQFADGVTARLMWLDQGDTCEGLLDGSPTYGVSEIMLEVFSRDRFWGRELPICIMRPKERREAIPDSDYQDLTLLPRFWYRGVFASGPFELSIVWFQDSEAPPINPAVKAELRNLDFRANAREQLSES